MKIFNTSAFKTLTLEDELGNQYTIPNVSIDNMNFDYIDSLQDYNNIEIKNKQYPMHVDYLQLYTCNCYLNTLYTPKTIVLGLIKVSHDIRFKKEFSIEEPKIIHINEVQFIIGDGLISPHYNYK